MSTRKKVLVGLGIYLLVAVALYVIFGSDGKNEEFKPQDEFKLDPWIEIKIGSLDLSFNKAVLYILLTCVLTIGTMVYIARRMEEKPNRTQTVMEGAYDLTYTQIARNNMPAEAAAILSITLFTFFFTSQMLTRPFESEGTR